MIKASMLRHIDELNKISSKPGYYKWWVSKAELDIILKVLEISFSEVEKALETKSGLFCVYIGIAARESVRARLNWHINDSHTVSRVKNGTLSTLRQSISSIVSHNQYDKISTDLFIDKMFVEYFYVDSPIKSDITKTALHEIETKLMAEYLRILNIQNNHYPFCDSIKSKLKQLRKESKSKTEKVTIF